jgi:hypothetical protein
MAAKLNRMILQLRAMRTKMTLAGPANTDVPAAGEQASKTARSTGRPSEAPRRAARRRSHG